MRDPVIRSLRRLAANVVVLTVIAFLALGAPALAQTTGGGGAGQTGGGTEGGAEQGGDSPGEAEGGGGGPAKTCSAFGCRPQQGNPIQELGGMIAFSVALAAVGGGIARRFVQ